MRALALFFLLTLCAGAVEPLDGPEDLRKAFEEQKGHPRLMLFLSPGCKGCFWAVNWVERNVEVPGLKILLVWTPVFPTDAEERATDSQDPRVSAYYDRDAATARWFYQTHVKDWPGLKEKPAFRREKVWDSFFLYGPDASWDGLRTDAFAAGCTVQLERQKLLEAAARLAQPAAGQPPRPSER